MHIYLPHGFNPETDIVGYQRKYHEKYCWFIHTVINEAQERRNHYEGYVNLSSNLIGHFLGEAYYTGIIEVLKSSGIIEENSSYSVGAFSKSYRLLPAYSDRAIEFIPFETSKAQGYIRKLIRWQEQKLAAILENPIYRCLYENLCNVEFNAIEAGEFLNANRSSLSTEEFDSRKIAIRKLATQNYFFTVDENTGRVYNNITSLPREFRKFLRINEEVLSHLDIRNSQPVLFCPLLTDFLTDAYENHKALYQDPDLEAGLLVRNGHLIFFDPQIPQEAISREVPADIQLYFELTQEGQFYDRFMQFLQEKGEQDIPPRSEFKEDFFKRVFFSTTARQMEYKYEKWFREWMPNVSYIISWYKRNDYRDLASELQKKESNVMINTVGSKIMELSDPAPFFLTVHDSIICQQGYENTAREIIENSFRECYQLSPTVNVENLE